jgi:DNA-cytosine methyltransferase
MNVLSLFDGMSCGQQALERCGINVTNYYASEIDKYAIKVTQHNYPKTIQLGSVVDINVFELPKIDLLIGGSPCQSFSFAGLRKGMSTKCEQEILTLNHYLQLKEEGFEFEGQSYLFWEYMRILNDIRKTNPNVYLLLENVEMGEKWELILSRAIGVKGIHINSSLVSAQNRKRIYWTNIGMQPMGLFGDLESIIQQPKDKGYLLKDILETEVDEKYYLSKKMIEGFKIHNQKHQEKGTGFLWNPTDGNKKGACLRAFGAVAATDDAIIVTNNKRLNETLSNNKLVENCLIDSYNQSIHFDKSITISTRINASSCTHIYKNSRIRRLTPIECERLQTVADNYTSCVSDTQRYKMLGNGWTIDVICHIFNYLK